MNTIILILLTTIALLLIFVLIYIRKNSNISSVTTNHIDQILKEEFFRNREESSSNAKQVREELNNSFRFLSDTFFNRIMDISNLQKNQLNLFQENLTLLSKTVDEKVEQFRDSMENRLHNFQVEQQQASKENREELSANLKQITDTLVKQLSESNMLIKKELNQYSQQLEKLTQSNEQKFEQLREKVEDKLKAIHENNSQKLDEMRAVVDEKLHTTLEKRLGESFKLVSEKLEQVYSGLGEMKNLASGVGDLKKVLTNIKTRGTWGEIQLGNLIEQILTPEQYCKNIATKKGSSDRVEFAIKMPGRNDNKEEIVWLPIDAKFPLEDYQRLCDAQELANTILVEEAGKALENRIKEEAKKICDKYLDPPHTTDFAILFLPVEGLYAEVLRRSGVFDKIQKDYRVIMAGPTTLAAILNSLQMGFRTLAIEKRSSEVWKLLGTVKTDFGTFGDLLDRTKKKLQEASNTIDNASTASRRIERKLKDVQALPSAELNLLTDDNGIMNFDE